MSTLLIPSQLQPWDTVATVSLSWWGAGELPHRYQAGKEQLEAAFGVKVKEMPNALQPAQFVYEHPELRAQDLMQALQDPEVKAIISNIGWDDAIRLLPYIDFDIIKKNPKIFLGFSDTTAVHFMFYHAGVRSYYGPAILAWFAENTGIMPYMKESIDRVLFTNTPIGQIHPNTDWWTSQLLPWIPENQNTPRELLPNEWRNRLQGEWVVQWELLGWCLQLFPFMIGTKIRPTLEQRKDKILFFEIADDEMDSQTEVTRILRNLAAQGIFKVIKWVLVGRSTRNRKTGEKIAYDETILKVIAGEEKHHDLPVITNMDFWHTAPTMTLPIGALTEIDCASQKISILESGVR